MKHLAVLLLMLSGVLYGQQVINTTVFEYEEDTYTHIYTAGVTPCYYDYTITATSTIEVVSGVVVIGGVPYNVDDSFREQFQPFRNELTRNVTETIEVDRYTRCGVYPPVIRNFRVVDQDGNAVTGVLVGTTYGITYEVDDQDGQEIEVTIAAGIGVQYINEPSTIQWTPKSSDIQGGRINVFLLARTPYKDGRNESSTTFLQITAL